MNKQIVDPFVITAPPSLRGAKRRGNPVQRTVPSSARDLPVARKDPSIHLRRPQDDSIGAERLRGVYPERSRRARNDNSESRSSAGRQDGWTLIEVLVAVVILCVGLLAVGTMQISAIRGNFMGGNTSIALTLAGQKMEDLFNRNYTDAALTSGAHTEQVSDSGVVAAGGFYRRNWNIVDSVTGAANWPTMKEITVTVNWEGNRHRVTISSMRRP